MSDGNKYDFLENDCINMHVLVVPKLKKKKVKYIIKINRNINLYDIQRQRMGNYIKKSNWKHVLNKNQKSKIFL